MDPFSMQDNEDQEADRVILNVGGVHFETYVTTLQNIADTRLAWLIENVEEETLRKREFFFDRHPGAFVHILNFYRTGKLHTPTDLCGPAFEEELQFWGIDEKQMEPCCWETFTKHREAESNLRTFEGPGFEDLQVTRRRKYSNFNSHDDESFMKRNMRQIWDLMNDPHSSELAKRFSLLSCGMIIISLSVYCLLTMRSLREDSILKWINKICLVFFTIEFILRVIVCPRKIQFIKDYKNWIDFLSLIPSFLMIAFPGSNWIYNLVIIRLLRVFKFFKLSYGLQVLLHTLKASSYELTLLLLVLLIPLVVFSSLVYAFEFNMTDGETDFDSIPKTFWWTIVTMTTVGYGDMAPKTWIGQVVGSICAIISVLIIALPISVIGNNFNLYYAHVRARLKLPKKNRHLLQGRLRGLLKQPAMLSSRDRDRKNITRRNGGNSLSMPPAGNGRLTVDTLSPSPNFMLKRRGAAQTTSQISLSSSNESIANDEKQETFVKIDSNSPKTSTDESTPMINERRSRQCSLEVNHVTKENDRRSPNTRRRRLNTQEEAHNHFPVNGRGSEVGIRYSTEDINDNLSGSSDSIILPSVSLTKEELENHFKNAYSQNNENVTESGDENDDQFSLSPTKNLLHIVGNNDEPNIRRESMKRMTTVDYNQNTKNTKERLRSNTLNSDDMNHKEKLRKQNTIASSSPGGLLRKISSPPLFLNHLLGNGDGGAERRKNSLDRDKIQRSSSKELNGEKPAQNNVNHNSLEDHMDGEKLHSKNTGTENCIPASRPYKRPLQRSATDHNFYVDQNHRDGDQKHHLPNFSLSIDNISLNKYKLTDEERKMLLRESGV
eukprot:TCONS_00053541-protein